MKVLVIQGGGKSEHAVSIRSGAAVARALIANGHEVRTYDPAEDIDYAQLPELAAWCDVAFPVVHGWGGEDGTLQAALDAVRVLYVGSDAEASARCFDKDQSLQCVSAAGIQIPLTQRVGHEDVARSSLVNEPFVLKPVRDGSSVGTIIVRDPVQFDHLSSQQVFDAHGNDMLLEELIVGTELTVAVLDSGALPVIEIVPPKNAEFDYENKYNGATQELCPPQTIPLAVQQQAQQIATLAHKTLGCRHYSRTDLIWHTTRGLFYLETNTLPGMTDQSLFPLAARTAGIDMPTLTDRLVRMAIAP